MEKRRKVEGNEGEGRKQWDENGWRLKVNGNKTA